MAATEAVTMAAAPPGSGAWDRAAILDLFAQPFGELLYRAQFEHRRHFDPTEIQLSTLLNIKTGGCPENCGYCAQSVHFDTGVAAAKLMPVDAICAVATRAKAAGAARFCMGAAWRQLADRDLGRIAEIIAVVRGLGLETCMTLGMLNAAQAVRLKEAGLDFYNHNIDTSPDYYERVVTTRTFDDRLATIAAVRAAGIKVCCGGIIGMGESRADRAAMLAVLAGLDPHPESVPINLLVPIPGTPLGAGPALDVFEFVRTIAVARVAMPTAYVRLSAGRRGLSDEAQALCFFAGANSIFYGDRLLTTGNPDQAHDLLLFERLGLKPGG